MVEVRRQVEAQVRVVRHQRAPVLGAPAGHGPLVAADLLLGAGERVLQERHAVVAPAQVLDRAARAAVEGNRAGGARRGFGRGLRLRRGRGLAEAAEEGCAAGRVGDRRSGVERRGAEHVAEERRRADRRTERAGVRLVVLRRAGVEVERELEGERLADHRAVERGPRLELRDLEGAVLRRQRVARHVGVHAVGIRLQRRAQRGRVVLQRALCRAAQADRLQFDVARQYRVAGARAEQRSQRAARLPPDHVDLEQAVLRGHPALQEHRVVLVVRVDVRHAVHVAQDARRTMQLRQRDRRVLDLSGRVGAGERQR